jgi:multicomponent K+:H+ antiporter subunit E
VLGPEAAIAPRWVWVPLRIRAPHGIVALAGIVTMTPGTLSADLSDDRRCLLVHALHCPDDAAEAQLRADIHARYEAPLMEMLE